MALTPERIKTVEAEFRAFRSNFLLLWMFSNIALVQIIIQFNLNDVYLIALLGFSLFYTGGRAVLAFMFTVHQMVRQKRVEWARRSAAPVRHKLGNVPSSPVSSGGADSWGRHESSRRLLADQTRRGSESPSSSLLARDRDTTDTSTSGNGHVEVTNGLADHAPSSATVAGRPVVTSGNFGSFGTPVMLNASAVTGAPSSTSSSSSKLQLGTAAQQSQSAVRPPSGAVRRHVGSDTPPHSASLEVPTLSAAPLL